MYSQSTRALYTLLLCTLYVGCIENGSIAADSKRSDQSLDIDQHSDSIDGFSTLTEDQFLEELSDMNIAQLADMDHSDLLDMFADMNIDMFADTPTDMSVENQSENLILNPSFEEDLPAWSIWGGASRIEEHAQSGSWSLRTTNGNGAEQRIEGLIPGARYRLSGWGKTEGAEPLLIGVKDYGGEQVQLPFFESVYAYDQLDFTVGATHREAIVFIYKHRNDQPGHGDSISLTLQSNPNLDLPPHLDDLTLVWSDEFDGSGPVDSDKWNFEEGFARNEELQWYQADNAFREDGVLVIEGRRENRVNPTYEARSNDWRTRREMINYTSASIQTRQAFDWQYGRLEVRAKVTNAVGTWPAIWTLGVDCEWPSNGEVDVMENYGGDLLANFAWGTNRRWNAQWDSERFAVNRLGVGWTDEFHIWTLNWDENQMMIAVDGVELNRIDLNSVSNGSAQCEGQNPFRQPHYLLLNLALGSNGGPIDTLSFPTRYLVDYVRIYQ